jgi:DNA-binding MarR family transcriptional regulator
MQKAMEPFRKTTDLEMEKLLKVMELFRSYDPELPAQVISVFLYIASHNDCSKVQLQDKTDGLNMPSASASRNTDWLSHKHRLGKRGLNWIVKYRDKTDKRKQIMKLSAQGQFLIEQLREILYG